MTSKTRGEAGGAPVTPIELLEQVREAGREIEEIRQLARSSTERIDALQESTTRMHARLTQTQREDTIRHIIAEELDALQQRRNNHNTKESNR